MKKCIAFILAVVYLFAALPGAGNWYSCAGDYEEQQHVKTEDHHGVSAGAFRMTPLSPALATGRAYLTQERIAIVLLPSYFSISIPGGNIPLFVRHCNFRI